MVRNSPIPMWLLACIASIGAHAMLLAALALVIPGRAHLRPRIEVPDGESSAIHVFLMPSAEVRADPAREPTVDDAIGAIALQQSSATPREPMIVSAPRPWIPETTIDPDLPEAMARPDVDSTWLADSDTTKRGAPRELQPHVERDRPRLAQSAMSVLELAAEVDEHLAALTPSEALAASEQAEPASAGGTPGVMTAPRANATNDPPHYPEESRRRKETGTVWLHLAIDADGAVHDVAVTASSGFDRLDRAARDAVRGWRFAPATEDGIATHCEIDVPIVFVLK